MPRNTRMKLKLLKKRMERLVNIKNLSLLLVLFTVFSSISTIAAPDPAKDINIAPTVDLNVTPAKKPVDIVILTDYTGAKLTALNTQINLLRAKFSSVNVDPVFHIVSDVKKIGTQDDELYTFRRYARYWYMYDEYKYQSSSDAYTRYNDWVEVPVLWEETQGLLSQYNDLPKRNPQNISFIRTGPFSYTSPSGNLNTTYYQVALSCTNDVKTSYFIDELIKTWASSMYYGFKNIIDEYLAIDKEWVLGPKVSDVTYDIYSLNFDKLSVLPLRAGSDKHMLLISDSLKKNYGQSFGNYFSFGGLTEAVSKYIKDNNFSLYGVMPDELIDLTFADDKVADIFAIGETTLFRMENGEVRKLGNPYYNGEGAAYEKAYPVTATDVSNPTKVMSYYGYHGNYTYYYMDNTYKYYDAQRKAFMPVSGLPAIRQIYREGTNDSQCFILGTDGRVYRFDLETRDVTLENYGGQPTFSKIAGYGEKAIFITGSGEAYVLSDEYRNGDWVSGLYKRLKIRTENANGDYVERDMPLVKDVVSFSAANGSSLGGILVLYTDGTIQQFTGFHSEYITQTKNYKYYKEYIEEDTAYSILETNVSSLIDNDVNVFIVKNDGTVRVLRPDWIEHTSSKGTIYYTGEYRKSTIATPMANVTSFYWSEFNKHFFKGSNGHIYMYTYTDAAEDPVLGSNLLDLGTEVKKIVDDYKNKTLYILFNDGTVREITFTFSNYYREATNTYPAYENVKNLYVSCSNMYVLYNDGTVKGKGYTDYGQLGFISSSKVTTLTNPFATALIYDKALYEYSIRSAFNDSTIGTFYPSEGYATAFDDIYTKYSSYSGSGNMYVLLGDDIKYESSYNDYESDPEYSRKWSIAHDPTYFDNSMGLSVYHNPIGFTTNPPVKLDRTGKYVINLKARDNPKADDRFDIYRLWSLGDQNLTVYIHRKPVAMQKVTITNNGNGTYTVKALDAGSYDLDHSISRADKGIAAREWRWKESTSDVWTSGQMNKTDCNPDKRYITQLRVKDLEGAWSDYTTITIDKNNPPVALFTIDKNLIKTTDILKLKDQSFPQSFSTMSNWHWIVKKLNSDGSAPAANLQDAKYTTSNAGIGSLAGYDANVKTNYSSNGVGKYRIYLRVKDSNGLWSDGGTDAAQNLSNFYSQDITVDTPPTASFTIANGTMKTTDLLKLTDTSTGSAVSSVIQWHWTVKKLNSDGSVPATNLQDAQFSTHNAGTGALAGCDTNVKTDYSGSGVGTYRIYLRVKNSNGMWSDGGTDAAPILSSSFYRDIIVDTPPIASFTIAKNPINITEILKLKDTSTTAGVTAINRWHWIVKKLNTDGSVPATNLQDAQFTTHNAGTGALAGYDANVKTNYSSTGVGTYRIYLRVRNGSGMWSDGGTDATPNLASMYYQDLKVELGYQLSNFRVSIIRDFKLESYYRDSNGNYPDKDMFVNSMAIDPDTFIYAGTDLAPDFETLTKGYKFEYEIDSKNFNDSSDTIVITPSFYSYYGGVPGTRGSEVDLYWEDSNHLIYKAGQGAHAPWNTVTLTSSDRTISNSTDATWRGEYLIPGTSWAVPKGTTAANAAASKLSADIIVNFNIKGYKNGVMSFDYNLQQWPVERTVIKSPYQVGDVIRYDYRSNNMDDIKAYRTH